MKFDLNKILDVLNLSYNQLRNTLIVSIFIIFTLASGVSIKSCSKNDKKDELSDIQRLENKIRHNEILVNNRFFELYDDVLELNYRNNMHWNTKFNIFLRYGEDQELFDDLIRIQDEQQRLYEEDRRTRMKYRLLPDSLIN